MEPIRWENHTLYLLDQTKLPLETIWISCTDYLAAAQAIKTMVVRGAPAIGVTAGYAYCLAAQTYREDPSFPAKMRAAKAHLAASRPTAVNLFWALDRMEARLAASGNVSSALPALIAEAEAIHREDVAQNRAMGQLGAEVVPPQARILTHCNAGALATGGYGTALGVIRAAFAQGKVSQVYADETRPLLQGARLTAYELMEDHIPVTLITDSMAGALMAQHKVDLVIVGCDRMAANGDFANKIGTYSLAVNAHYHKVPFYTALPGSTVDLSLPNGDCIPIEERDGGEVRTLCGVQTAPGQVDTWNPAFDVTPHNLLTGIITEKAVLSPPFQPKLCRLFGPAAG